jgi:hypothetical protein
MANDEQKGNGKPASTGKPKGCGCGCGTAKPK